MEQATREVVWGSVSLALAFEELKAGVGEYRVAFDRRVDDAAFAATYPVNGSASDQVTWCQQLALACIRDVEGTDLPARSERIPDQGKFEPVKAGAAERPPPTVE